jgi:DNA-binding NtrC family response regulator
MPREEIREIPQALPSSLHVPRTIKENDIAGDKRLLVVDDNIHLLKFLQASFSESYNVFLARNTDEALVKLRIIPGRNVIVSDIMMDGTDGFGLLSVLQEKTDITTFHSFSSPPSAMKMKN